jgi:hypothetical protein
MNLINSSLNLQKRRGLSSIVGALIFVVLMVAAFAVLGVAMDTQTDIVDVNRDVADTGLKKQQENFVINKIFQNDADFLEVHVTNKAQNPTEIFTMVITNSSDSANGFPTTTHDVPYGNSFLPPFADQPTNILEGANLKMGITADGVDEKYDIKIISSLGNVQTYNIICNDTSCGLSTSDPGSGGLDVQLLLNGATGVNTKTTTVMMFVTNTGNATVTNVKPVEGCSTTPNILSSINGVPYPGTFPDCDFQSPNPVDLLPGQTAFFKWDGTVSGNIDDELLFCNTAEGDSVVSPVEECDLLTIIDPNDCGGCEGGEGTPPLVLVDDLLVRPSVFMIIPSPFGETADPSSDPSYKGVWGINVANPTETPMDVTKVTIAAYPPGTTPGDVVVEKNDCNPVDLSPGDTFNEMLQKESGLFSGNWECPRMNVIMWQNSTHPLTIDARSNKSFLVQTTPGSPSSGGQLDAIIIQANVFTTSGSFGKSGYQTTMFQSPIEASLVNVYLSDTNDSRTDIQSQRLGIFSNSTETFKIVFADMDNDEETGVATNAKVIINVPREWTNITVTNSTGFITGDPGVQPSVVKHGDLSTQIIATTSSAVGSCVNLDPKDQTCPANDPLNPVAKTITFTAKAPDVTEDGVKRLYVMYVLADGLTQSEPAKTVGPLNEIILQVLPTVS